MEMAQAGEILGIQGKDPSQIAMTVDPTLAQRRYCRLDIGPLDYRRNKMSATLLTTFSNPFSLMEIFEFRSEFHLKFVP